MGVCGEHFQSLVVGLLNACDSSDKLGAGDDESTEYQAEPTHGDDA